MTYICSLMATEELISVCGCKGIRTCLRCEAEKSKQHLLQTNELVSRHVTYKKRNDCLLRWDDRLFQQDLPQRVPISALKKTVLLQIHYDFIYDPVTKSAVREENGARQSFAFPGVFLWENFVSEDEEKELVAAMDQNVWRESQSGRRKQDFGPKVNFKKHKVRVGDFTGLPAVSRCLVERMRRTPQLASFKPVEQCNLDYDPSRGSAIDPHLDDSWLWGEHLVTINLLSNTVLTMNLDQGWGNMDTGEVRVAVHLPRRSLVVLFGEARHQWKHAICRKDVHGRRVCSTFRELSADFLPGGEQEKLGFELLDIALKFKGTPL